MGRSIIFSMEKLLKFKNVILIVFMTVGYILLGFVGRALAPTDSFAIPIWPAAGFAIGMAYIHGPWITIGTLIGATLNIFIQTYDPFISVLIGVSSCILALAGGLIVRTLTEKSSFKDYTDLLAVTIAGATGPLFTATVGTYLLLQNGIIQQTEIGQSWFTWWSGDLIGILIIMPLFLELKEKTFKDLSWAKVIEASFTLGLILLILYFTFTRNLNQAYIWVAGPLFIISGIRTGRFYASIMLILVSSFAVALILSGHGPSHYGNTQRNLHYVQTLIVAFSMCVLAIKEIRMGEKVKLRSILGLSTAAGVLFILTYITSYFERKNTFDDYKRMTDAALISMEKAMDMCELVLKGTSGAFSISTEITRDEWKAFVNSLQITSFMNSIYGVGYIAPVKKENLKQHLKRHNIKLRIIDEEFAAKNDSHYIVTFNEPMKLDALGLDIGSEARRKRAIELSRMLGKSVATEPFYFYQKDLEGDAFAVYHPAWNENKKFMGWTYAPIISKVFFGHHMRAYTERLNMRVLINGKLLYSSNPSAEPFRKDSFFISKTKTFFEMPFEIQFYPSEEFFNRHSDYALAIPLIMNLLAMVIAALIMEQMTFSLRAEELVEQRTKELDQSRMQLMESSKMASLGEMASGMAHEINNPLTIIQGKLKVIQFILGDLKIQDRQLFDELGKIKLTTERIEKIVRGLRNFSRTAINDPFELADLKDIVNETLDLCAQKIKAEGIDLRIAEIPQVTISCRATQISQVLVNLLNNARDAIQELDEKWIEISFKTDEKNIIITTTDSGKGIAPDILEKIMDPFFTTKPVGKGTGLGLSISREIISNHKGKLWVDKTSSNTTFVIELPLMKESSSAS